MLYSSILRGCVRDCRTRITMILPYTTPKVPVSNTNTRFSATMESKVYCGSSTSNVGVYVPPVRRLRSVIASANGTLTTAKSIEYDEWRENQGVSVGKGYEWFQMQQRSGFARYAYDDYSEEDSDQDNDVSSSGKSASTADNVDEWKWKLTMFLRNGNEQEVVSRERKDRRDYDQLAAMASRMGLYSRQYAKVIVFSKTPLPNYRSDLDDKRPQREVSIPPVLHGEINYLLEQYFSRKRMSGDKLSGTAFSRSSSNDSFATVEGNTDQDLQTSPNIVMEKIINRRSLHLLNLQRSWQESPEGKRMQEFRQSLPAYKEKDALLAAVAENQVVVISGETGCGKTTQLPQYILESEISATRGAACSIICTQPRRISAMSVSERVAAERGEKLGESVGYKVRLEGVKGRDTRLLFCTTGILLRRLLVDRNLNGITHVIVDEIHERGMNEDFLLIVLKDLLPRRPELRLILMSATLNAELFSSYFGGAPMLHIPGFTYPVRTHFLESILEMTGHRLTPYNQIDDYGQEKSWKMQKQALRKRKSQIVSVVEDALDAADFRECSLRTRESLTCWNPDSIGFNLIESVLVHICQKERSGAVLVFMTGWDDINSLKDQLQAHPLLGDPNKVLLLACHGSMASSEQRLIFDKAEEGVRKIVLATNMAETSITINDVVFVVDCGKAKETSYDALNNTPCLLPSWISKASARQRRGRAGRVQPGECYHLYPKCVYDVFAEYQLPELLRTPLQSLCLQIKSLRLGSISEFLSRALQSPELLSVQNAVEYLKIIGALDEKEELTALGRLLAMLPVEPKLGKMLIYGAIFNCLDPILTVVAGLSARDPFLMPFDKKDLAESAKSQFSRREYSDHIALVRAFEAWKDASTSTMTPTGIPTVTLNSGFEMPMVGFGTGVFLPDDQLVEVFLNGVKAGHRHFDTAALYGTERALGKAIAKAIRQGLVKSREELFVTSKLWCTDADGELVVPAIKKSLENLGLEYLDLYLIHWPLRMKKKDSYYPFEEEDFLPMDTRSTWAAMEECQKLGLTKSIGVSNFSSKKVADLLAFATIPPAVNQVEMNPVWDQRKLRGFCKENGIQVAAYSPLGANGAPWGTMNVMNCPTLKEIAEAKGKTLPQICLRWVLEQGVIVISRSYNEGRMKENLQIFDWELDEEEKKKISKIPQKRGFPGEPFVSPSGPYKTVDEIWDEDT